MFRADLKPFCELLDEVYELHGKTLTDGAKAIFFRSLALYPLDTVRLALSAHVKDPQRGQYPPKPADVIAQIEGDAANDTRPGPEEAWAIAAQALDESNTVMLNNEIAEAWGIAAPIVELGDEVGARMAFREAYVRLVAKARGTGLPAVWWPSIGTDAEKRHTALQRAVSQGLIAATAPVVQAALPAPTDATALLSAPTPTVDARTALDGLRKFLARDADAEEAERQERMQRERDATAARKAELREQAESRGVTDDGYEEIKPE